MSEEGTGVFGLIVNIIAMMGIYACLIVGINVEQQWRARGSKVRAKHPLYPEPCMEVFYCDQCGDTIPCTCDGQVNWE